MPRRLPSLMTLIFLKSSDFLKDSDLIFHRMSFGCDLSDVFLMIILMSHFFLEEEHRSRVPSYHSKHTCYQYDIIVDVNLDHLDKSLSLFTT